MDLHRHLPADLRDCDVLAVSVVGSFRVRVTHRDGTSATHIFDPTGFRGDFTALRDPAVFATAWVLDRTLGWELPGGVVYDLAPDTLWLHAHGHCDGSHDLTAAVER